MTRLEHKAETLIVLEWIAKNYLLVKHKSEPLWEDSKGKRFSTVELLFEYERKKLIKEQQTIQHE